MVTALWATGSRNGFWAVQLVHSGSFDSYKEMSLRRAHLYTAAQISHSLKSCPPEEVMAVSNTTVVHPWQQNYPALQDQRHIQVEPMYMTTISLTSHVEVVLSN